MELLLFKKYIFLLIFIYSNYKLLYISNLCYYFIYFSEKLLVMEKLTLSNSCLNCLNINEDTQECGVHHIEVSEKYTCTDFSGVE